MLRFHFAAYNEAVGTVTNSDVDAVADGVFTRRNSHLIFTENYDLLAVYAGAANITRARFGNISLTQKGNNHIWPVERSATIPDLPQIMDFRDQPMRLPRDEELTIEVTTDGPAMGTADVDFGLWIGAPGWSRNRARGIDRFVTRATVVIAAGAESAWTALAEPVFERDLMQGVYAVNGAWLVAANAIAFRLRFPDERDVDGKQLRPGSLVQNAIGDSPNRFVNGDMGEWGRFHTFSPPEVQVLDDTAGGTYELRLDLSYMGSDRTLITG